MEHKDIDRLFQEKDIDRLFQERLKDVEITPNPEVWNAIEQKIQKKKRRILPFWWFSGGVAAVFVMGLFFFSNKNNKQEINNLPVITKETIKNENEIDFKSKKIEIVTVEEKTDKKETKSTNIKPVQQEIVDNVNPKGASKKIHKKDTNSNENSSLNLINSKINERKNNNNSEGVIMKGIAAFDDIIIKEKSNIIDSKIIKRENNNDSEGVIMKGIAASDDIVNKNNSKKDFITEINSNNEPLKEESEKEKWSISPVLGILKSNSFSNVSPLDSDLNNNNFSGENTFAFGVNVTYQIHKKWAIKSGVQLQKTGFVTDDVTLINSALLVANSLDNVSVNPTNNFSSVSSMDQLDFSSDLSTEQIEGNTEQGNLQQNYSYIEIPLEIKYTFFSSKKINTSVVSGFSSLILNENNIIGESSSFNTTIGEANNLNSLNFSGNLGLEFDLKLSRKLNLNINPMFKTQLNTFSNNSNGFRPYNIGVYSGLRYYF